MEYLATYSWAILFIVVALGVMYYLGFFSSQASSIRAQPGSCSVYRPNGAGSTSYLTLAGSCGNQLPQYVALFNGNSHILASIPYLPSGSEPVTVTVWFYYENTPNIMLLSYGNTSYHGCGDGNYYSFRIGVDCGSTYIESDPWCSQTCAPTPAPLAKGTWYFAALISNSTGQTIYGGVDGKLYGKTGGVPSNILSTGQLVIGMGSDGSNLVGGVSNVQVYNATLTESELQSLYSEGIGGAPINLQNLIAWYPLNGDANDYSGNQQNGAPFNITYSSAWTSGYNAP